MTARRQIARRMEAVMELTEARQIAEKLIAGLSSHCERIEIAGSIRRCKPEVHDIELIAIPKMLPDYDLFGQQCGERSLLGDRRLYERFGKVVKAGKRFVQVNLFDGIMLDLFVVLPPAQWGVLFAIRTGPAEFSHWLVTPRNKGGGLPSGWRVEDGRVWDGQVTLDFPDELKLFEWVGLGWVEPADRRAGWGTLPAWR